MEDMNNSASSGTTKPLDVNGFIGHALPASFFFGIGVFGLVLTMKRLLRSSSTQEFLEKHIPERNMNLLKRVGIVLMIVTSAGIFVEGSPHGRVNVSIFRHLQHQTLYLMFGSSGLVALLESCNYVPVESFRVAVALCFFGETILWHEHSLMKMNPIDMRVHALLTYTSLGSAVAICCSIARPKLLFPYIGVFVSMIWQALWLVAAGYNIMVGGCFTTEQVSSIFVLQGISLGLVSLMGVIVVHRKHLSSSSDVGGNNNNKNHIAYQSVLIGDDNDSDTTLEVDDDEELDEQRIMLTVV